MAPATSTQKRTGVGLTRYWPSASLTAGWAAMETRECSRCQGIPARSGLVASGSGVRGGKSLAGPEGLKIQLEWTHRAGPAALIWAASTPAGSKKLSPPLLQQIRPAPRPVQSRGEVLGGEKEASGLGVRQDQGHRYDLGKGDQELGGPGQGRPLPRRRGARACRGAALASAGARRAIAGRLSHGAERRGSDCGSVDRVSLLPQ